MIIEFLGKVYDNHSLSIVNRNIILELIKLGCKIRIIALDSYDPIYKLDKSIVKQLKSLENVEETDEPVVQIRHSYPPIWEWPNKENTHIIYIQPWEFTKAPFEWQYKFETFADHVIVPSNFTKKVFTSAGLSTNRINAIPNGYNPEIFNTKPANDMSKYGVDSNKFNFIYVGNAQWRKGLDILLNLWPKAFVKADKVRLIIKDNPKIYGKNNILEQIISLQYNDNCAEIVYIDDNLSEVEMADIYKHGKVLVHPYRAEGFAMHVQEAMACGCVPLVPSDGPTDDFIEEGKGLIIPVSKHPVNIQSPEFFAMKPGDSLTMMSSHTFINEPSKEHLFKAMKFAYHSHNRNKVLAELHSTSKLTTWADVALQYKEVINKVASRTIRRI